MIRIDLLAYVIVEADHRFNVLCTFFLAMLDAVPGALPFWERLCLQCRTSVLSRMDWAAMHDRGDI